MLNANQRLALEHGLLHQRLASAEEERDRLRERVSELEKELKPEKNQTSVSKDK